MSIWKLEFGSVTIEHVWIWKLEVGIRQCHPEPARPGPARNSDASLFRRLNVPKYFPLDRHVTIPTVQCSENETHWSEGPLVRLFEKEAH